MPFLKISTIRDYLNSHDLLIPICKYYLLIPDIENYS